MSIFEKTKTECVRCTKDMAYFGMPKNYVHVNHTIYPICEHCAREIAAGEKII